MPKYLYYARDIQGKEIQGTITSESERAGREFLRLKNLFVTQITLLQGDEKAVTKSTGTLVPPRVKLYDMVIFSRQLATLVRAGLTLLDALTALAEQTRNPTLRRTIEAMIAEVRGGQTFAASARMHPQIFSELFLALIEAGELGGMLDVTLDTAAKALDTEMEIREKVRSAFVYPIAVGVTAVGVVTAMLVFVVPVFSNVYKSFRAELPFITQILVKSSDLIRNYWWSFLILMLLTPFLYKLILSKPAGRLMVDRIKVRIPLFGPLIDKIALARMAHTLASLSNAGISLIQALPTAGRISGDSTIVSALQAVSERVQEGVGMGIAMQDTERFPLLLTRMIHSGELSGNLSEMIEQAAIFFDREVDYGVKRLMTMIEPILTVVMGFVVGFILLALYLPVFTLSQVIK